MKRSKRRLVMLAGLILAAGLAGFGIWKWNHPWKIVRVEQEVGRPMPDIGYVVRWEEMTITQQFCWAKLGDKSYGGTGGVVLPADRIGEFLGTAVLSGEDVYRDKIHTREGGCYAITGITPEYAVGIELEGEVYVYVDHAYKPDTLGQFLDELNVREEVVFQRLSYDYTRPLGGWGEVEFFGWDTELPWEMLLSAREAENHGDVERLPVMTFAIDVPLFGYENIALAVTENGYLWTNILSNETTFYLGPDRVRAFVDHVKETYEGVETVYVYVEAKDNPGPLKPEEPVAWEPGEEGTP